MIKMGKSGRGRAWVLPAQKGGKHCVTGVVKNSPCLLPPPPLISRMLLCSCGAFLVFLFGEWWENDGTWCCSLNNFLSFSTTDTLFFLFSKPLLYCEEKGTERRISFFPYILNTLFPTSGRNKSGEKTRKTLKEKKGRGRKRRQLIYLARDLRAKP